MEHPEYLYWFVLALFGVPAVVWGRSPLPLLVVACSIGDASFWAVWPSPQAEGLFLAALYGSMLVLTARFRFDAAETFAAALWSPMAFCAIAQTAGADPVSSYWAIYGLAVLQALAFAFVSRWPYGIVELIKRQNERRDDGGLRACPA